MEDFLRWEISATSIDTHIPSSLAAIGRRLDFWDAFCRFIHTFSLRFVIGRVYVHTSAINFEALAYRVVRVAQPTSSRTYICANTKQWVAIHEEYCRSKQAEHY